LSTDDLSVTRYHDFKEFEGSALTYSEATNELWVGDKKGSLYIISGEDFSQK